MSTSKPTSAEPTRDRPATKAVDVAGTVWRHPCPAELYRFIKLRNDLLKTIIAGQA
jgi:hypothetical protein